MSTTPPKNPYVGPRPIRRGEAFYGRDPELRRLTNLLVAERIVLMHAPSGAGKSSLLNAGLLPKLEQEKKLQALPVLRVNRPPENAAALPKGTNRYLLSAMLSLEESFGEAALPEATLAQTDLSAYLDSRWPADPEKRGRLLLLDQFEEVFSLDPYDREAKQEFFVQLGEALQDRDLKALFVMRDDYIGALEPYAVRLPTQLQAAFRLDFLDHDAALDAILKPAEQAGVFFDPEAADELANDLSKVQFQHLDGTTEEQIGPYVEPVQLQVVCKRLWERLDAAGRLLDGIDKKDVKELGDVSDALAGYYRDSVSTVAREQKVSEAQIRRWVGSELISEQGVRGQVMLVAGMTKGIPNKVITGLEAAHLLRREERRRVIWYELAHDRLVPPVLRDNLRYYEAQRARRLKQVGAVLGVFVLAILIYAFTTTWRAGQQTAGAVEANNTATQVYLAAQQNARLSTQAAATAQVNDAMATQGAATATAEKRQADMALLPFSELQGLSRSSDVSTRIYAARALGSIGAADAKRAPEAAGTLASMMQAGNENNPEVRLEASLALWQLAQKNPGAAATVVKGILSVAGDSSSDVRSQAAHILGLVGPSLGQAELSQVNEALAALNRDPDERVRLAAAESIKTLAGLGMQSYVGGWINSDSETSSWTRIQISQRGAELGYHVYGKCQPTDCDAGEAWVPYAPGWQSFQIDHGYALRTFTVTLDTEAQQLYVETFSDYVDNSGRPDRYEKNLFKRGELVLATPTPLLRPTPAVVGPRLYTALFWESAGLATIDLRAGKIVNTTIFPSINARYLSFNPQRQEVYVSFSNGDTLYIVDAYSGEIKGKISEEVGWNSSASVVSADGGTLYLATTGGPEKERVHKILVIDPATQSLRKVIPVGRADFPAVLGGLLLSPDGSRLYTMDTELYHLKNINLETGEYEVYGTKGNQLAGITEDGRNVYLTNNGAIFMLDLENPENYREMYGVRQTIERVAVAGGLVYVPGEKGNILVLDEYDLSYIGEIEGPSGNVLVMSPDGSTLYTAVMEENMIYGYDVIGGKMLQRIRITNGSGPTDLVYWQGTGR